MTKKILKGPPTHTPGQTPSKHTFWGRANCILKGELHRGHNNFVTDAHLCI